MHGKGNGCTVFIVVSMTIYYYSNFWRSIGNASAHAQKFYYGRYFSSIRSGPVILGSRL